MLANLQKSPADYRLFPGTNSATSIITEITDQGFSVNASALSYTLPG